jgi:uracil-DNA glycosylase family 4
LFSIKNSFADCLSCPLFSEPSCILETNSKYLNEVKVLFIAENPGKDEIEKEKPLIGKSGKLFRKYFEKFGLDKVNYLLTNVVLCQTLNEDGTTGNPAPEVIERCKENCFKIIEECNPELIVLMGASPTSAFGLMPKGTGITNIRGEQFKWNDRNVFVMLHPSYINRVKNLEPTFEEDMKKVAGLVGLNPEEVKVVKNVNAKSGIFYYKIPDKYYTSDYKLIDVHFLGKTNEVLYIFRDKDNKKEFYKTTDEYVCYQCPDESKARKVVKYDELNQTRVSYKEKYSLNPKITYEGDLKITNKHAMDYYLQKKVEEPNLPMNEMFIDIETYAEGRTNSNAADVNDAIAIIRYSYGGLKRSLVLDPKVLKITNQTIDMSVGDITIFNSEVQLITTFINDVRKLEPDIITGWYSNDFDMQYIFNRAVKLRIDITKMSRFGEAGYNKYQFYPDAAGIVFLDMLELYKQFTFGGRESYSLDFIGRLELKKGKTDKGANFSNQFRTNVNEAISYNRNDVDLLEDLDKKLKHIFFQDELKRICKSTFKGSKSVLGQVDSLLVAFLKEKGYASKNSESSEHDVSFEGAYVLPPIVGVHDYDVDFDFASLYPSLMITYNIGVNTFVMKLEDYRLGYDLVYNPDKLPDKLEVIIDPLFDKKHATITKDQLLDKIKSSNLVYTINGCFFKNHSSELSFYAEIAEFLLGSRKLYKKKMFEAKNKKDDEKEKLYDTRQLVYKVLANSLYGALGNKVFRFFNVDSARSITLSGQEAIKNVMVSAENYVESLKSDKKPEEKYIRKDQMFMKDPEEKIAEFKNIITGDTDSIFLTYENILNKNETDEKKLENVNILNTNVQEYLNNVVMKNIVEKHNVTSDHNRLVLKNELVIKRGLFLAKKRYANHIISQEGNAVDEVKIMGLETKRSDFSLLTKDYLKQVIELILRPKVLSVPNVLEFVKEKNKLFLDAISSGITTVGRPVSFGKKLKEYKVIPQGVRGMLAWNDIEYKTFEVGSRGYLFKLKGIDLDKAPEEVRLNYDKNFLKKGVKLDVLVVPEEISNVPSYYMIDVKEMLDFTWTDRYKLLLEPLLTKKQEILKF